ncbi:hypothetical protein PENSPDRAFT_619854, partial [Peniophora sp. CONT]
MMEPTPQGNELEQISASGNDTFRIHDLPSETLIHALLCLRDIDPPVRNPSSDDPTPKTRLGWINTTHVSKYWREAILSCPSFWTRILLELGQTWTSAFMTRCKSIPFDILLDEHCLDGQTLSPWIKEFMYSNFHLA